MEAADLLAHDRVTARVVDVSTIKPLDEEGVRGMAADVALVVTTEEHSIIGGLGSAVAECLADVPGRAPLLRLGIRDRFGESGLADELLQKHGLQPKGIRDQILHTLRRYK